MDTFGVDNYILERGPVNALLHQYIGIIIMRRLINLFNCDYIISHKSLKLIY